MCPYFRGKISNAKISIAFLAFLSQAKHLESLGFNSLHKHMEYSQAIKLGSSLSYNTSLKELDLSNNPIRDEGLSAILDALRTNKNNKLEFINLTNCSLTDVGAMNLLAYLQEDNPLLQVYFDNIDSDKWTNTISHAIHQIALLTMKQKKLFSEEKNSQVEIIKAEPSPILINYASMAPRNTEQQREMTDTNDMDCISKKHNRM